jgi:hypothetical protein
MAEEVQQAEGQQTEEQKVEVEDQFAAADEQGNPNPEAPEPPSVDEIASRMGWVPKEKFRGEESKWKPADQFILDGNDIKDRHARELKEMRTTLDTVAKTSGAIMAERLQAQHEELERKYVAAVEKGDPDEAFKLGRQIDQIIDAKRNGTDPARAAPDASTVQWVEKNPWMKPDSPQYDPVAVARAIAVCDQYAKANLPAAEQVQKTEAILRREFPHLFNDGKPPPGVNAPDTRLSVPQKRGKTFGDLPKAAKDIAQDLVDRKLIPSVEHYTRNYFAAQEKVQ